jgi:CBS-domain-containing membrane protein
MNVLIDRLQTLRVADAMCDRIVEVPTYKTMAEAARVLADHHVSAAPVVDDHGRCVGLISTADFVKCVAELSDEAQPHKPAMRGDAGDWTACADATGHVVPPHDEPVARYMTAAVQTITAEAPLVTAARMMCAQHYHRLLVLDGTGRPAGVISTMDVVAALVHLADEVQDEWLRRDAPHGATHS